MRYTATNREQLKSSARKSWLCSQQGFVAVGRRISAGKSVFCWMLIASVLLVCPLPLLGQPENGTTPKPAPPAGVQPPPESSQVPLDLIYLPNQDGKPVAVPLNVTIEEFFSWIEDQGEKEAGGPGFIVKNLAGVASIIVDSQNRKWCSVDLTLEIDAEFSENWRPLPLRMSEAVLSGFEIVSVQPEAAPRNRVMVARDVDSDQWVLWSRGLNNLALKLNLLVPITRTGMQERLLMSCPDASRTELRLQVPERDLAISLESAGFLDRQVNAQGTLARIAGFQQTIDLKWSPQASSPSQEAVFDVESRIELSRQSSSTLIRAQQTLTVEQGVLDKLTVQLPAGFQLDNVVADRPIKYEFNASNPAIFDVIFSQPVQSTVSLQWELSSPIRRFESEISLDGFVVRGARRELGRIGILRSSDWRMTQNTSQSERVLPIDPRELGSKADLVQAYRYYSQPYRLVMAAQRAQTTFSSESYYDLLVRSDRMELSAEILITPQNGTLDSLTIDWKQFDAQQWELSAITSRGEQIDVVFEKADQLLLQVSQWQEPRSIRFQARRPMPAGWQKQAAEALLINCSLPNIVAPNSSSAFHDHFLRVSTDSFRYALELQREGIQVIPGQRWQQLKQTVEQYATPLGLASRENYFQLTDAMTEIPVKLLPVQQSSFCKKTVVVNSVNTTRNEVQVEMIFDLLVEEIPAETIQFEVLPVQGNAGSTPRLFFFDEQKGLLNLQNSPVNGQQKSSVYIYQPAAPVLGPIRFRAICELPLDMESESSCSLQVPVVRVTPADKISEFLQLAIPFECDVLSNDWEMVGRSDQATLLTTTQPDRSVDLMINLGRSRQSEDVGFIAASMVTRLSPDSSLASELSLMIARTPASLTIEREGMESFVSGVWSADGSSRIAILNVSMTEKQVVLQFPQEAVGRPGRCDLMFRHRERALGGALKSVALTLPEHSLSHRISSLSWTLGLPDGVYLLQPPDSLQIQHQWQWSRFGFRRLPLLQQGSQSAAFPPLNESGNSYLFTAYNWPHTVQFSGVGRGLLFTIGCGVPLLLFIVLIAATRPQRPFLILAVILLVSFLALNFPYQTAVLAQPLLLGLLTVAIASSLAWFFRPIPDEPTLIIIGPHHEQDDQSEAAIQMDIHGVGPDDVTRILPPKSDLLGSSRSR
ncbi:MAG: hypothetical protein KDA78_06620 [Planctomycetaceae bacterium]|nr:hypothetical protein [Planctomycetaceae bacterium]